MTTKISIDHQLIIPPELAQFHRVCLDAIREGGDMEFAINTVIQYQRCLVCAIRAQFTTDGETQKEYDPETQEVSPSALSNFNSAFQAHIVNVMEHMGVLAARREISSEDLNWFALRYPQLYNRRMRNSRLFDCVIPQEELERRENEAAERQRAEESAKWRKEWLLLGSTVTVQTVSAIILGPSSLNLTTAGLKIIAETAGTAALNTSVATIDDAVYGRASLNNSAESALKGASYGVVASTISTSLQAISYSGTTKPPENPPSNPLKIHSYASHSQAPAVQSKPATFSSGSVMFSPPSDGNINIQRTLNNNQISQTEENTSDSNIEMVTFSEFLTKLDQIKTKENKLKSTAGQKEEQTTPKTKGEVKLYALTDHKNVDSLLFKYAQNTSINQSLTLDSSITEYKK